MCYSSIVLKIPATAADSAPIKLKSRTEDIAVLGIWALIFFWVGAKTGDLRGDPLAYAVIAKKMALENNWLNPMLLNEPYLNKPPLFFWITGFFFKIFGVSYYVSKLPSLIFSTLAVWLLYALSLRWFKDSDTAFFTAFSFMSTRWVIRDFASTRPESLLVLGLLLGLFGFTLMLERRWSGPYLFGVSLAIMVMTKFTMALFLLVPVFIFAANRGKLRAWFSWPHFSPGLLLGACIPAIWIMHFNSLHHGYFQNMLFTQTIERATGGLDVHNSPTLYLKEILFYYHPWLIFFFAGLGVIWNRKKEDPVWFTLIAVFLMAAALQTSEGKMSRYLIPVTPFLSMISAHGVVRFKNVTGHMKRIIFLLGPVLLVFFWVVPTIVNPLVHRTVHVAAELQVKKQSYTKTFAFLHRDLTDTGAIPLVEWRHEGEESGYEHANYFYLPDSRRIWNDARLAEYVNDGREKIFLIAPTPYAEALPRADRTLWTRICSDETATLFLGQQR